MLPLIQQNQGAVSPSTALTCYIKSTIMFLTPVGPSNPMHCEVVRTATSALCKEMLQPGKSTGLGLRETKEVEARLRALSRLERVREENTNGISGTTTQIGSSAAMGDRDTGISASGEGRERRLFVDSLRDGYVLCQLMNKLRPQSIKMIDPREDGILRTSNMTKFLESCFANGFPPEDLFLRDDLIDATSESLARVAKSIIALVNWAETTAQTRPHLRRGEGNTKLDQKPRMCRPTPSGNPQIGASNGDSNPIQPKLIVHSSITHQKSKKSNVQSTKNQSNSLSIRDQSMTNQSTAHLRTKHSITPKNATDTYSSLPVPEAGSGNECSYVDKVGTNLRVPPIETAVDPLFVSGIYTSTSDDSKSGKTWDEDKAWTQFRLGNRIGHGPCANVYRAINSDTGQIVAVKQFQLEGFKEEQIVQLVQEVDLIKELSHPNIIQYEGMTRDKNALSIVLEYAPDGSLKQMLGEFGKLSEKLVASYMTQVLEGLEYLHHNDIVHGNLKAANILMTRSGDVKLSDFGVSLNLHALEDVSKGVSCTPNWVAPEVIELKRASTKSDIWSLGCTVIESLTGQPPYGDIVNTLSVMFRIIEDDGPPVPEGFSDALVAFLKECFHKALARRPNAMELSQHEWLNQNPNKELQPQSSIPFPQMVNNDQIKSDSVRHTKADLDLVDMPILESARQPSMIWWHRVRQIFAHLPARRQGTPRMFHIEPGLDSEYTFVDVDEHTFVDATFSKPVNCRVCVDPVERDAVLCSRCCTVAHSRCAARAPPGCDY